MKRVLTVSIEVLQQEVPGAVKSVNRQERAIYWLLRSANGGIVSAESLWNALHGNTPEGDWPEDESIVRVLIYRLRKKCPGVTIINHPGLGYSMEMK